SNPPRRRLMPVPRGTALDQLICDNHPLVPPQPLEMSNGFPCCLPFHLETPEDWQRLWEFTRAINGWMHLWPLDYGNGLSFRPGPSYQASDLINIFFQGHVDNETKTLIPWQSLQVISDSATKRIGGETHYFTVAFYTRNPNTKLFESSYPPEDQIGDRYAWEIVSDSDLDTGDPNVLKPLKRTHSRSLPLKLLEMAQMYGKPRWEAALRDLIPERKERKRG